MTTELNLHAGAGTISSASSHKNNLGTLNGCYVPCLLTILGATLFLRLGFAVGMMGFVGATAILVFAEYLSCITVTSFSAIAANGRNGAGGAYYMISRSLGLPFGAASGLLFWISYTLNATFNVVAFTEVIQSTFLPHYHPWGLEKRQVAYIISSATLFMCGGVAYRGAGAFAAINLIVFAGLAVACVTVIGNTFFQQEYLQLPRGANYTSAPFSAQILMDNMWPDPVISEQCFGKKCSLEVVFSVVFPAVIGMMEGLNLIGDLEDPVRSIPTGTFGAVGTAFVVYCSFLVAQAGSFSRSALQYDMSVLQESTVCGGGFVVLGVVTACLSTVLGALFGSARILQAMAVDSAYPGLGWCKYGTPQGNEPRPAMVVSWILAQLGLFIGNVDEVASLLTIFFLLTYCLTDLSGFLLEKFHKDEFKPAFRFYSWQTSLLNAVLDVGVMFYLSVPYSLLTGAIFLVALAWAWRLHHGREDLSESSDTDSSADESGPPLCSDEPPAVCR